MFADEDLPNSPKKLPFFPRCGRCVSETNGIGQIFSPPENERLEAMKMKVWSLEDDDISWKNVGDFQVPFAVNIFPPGVF